MTIATFDRFGASLESHWKGLEPLAEQYVFQNHDWLRFWQETVGVALGVQPWIAVLLDEGGRPRMIFPFGIRQVGPARVLEFLGASQGDYLGPIIHREWLGDLAAIGKAWQLVKEELPRHDARHFVKLPALWVREANPMLQIWQTRLQDRSFSASLPASWEEYQNRLRSKLRADNKRQRKRLGEMGRLTFEVMAGDGAWATEMDALIAQKRERYRRTGVPDILALAEVRRFYRDLSLGGDGPQVHLSVLKLDGLTLAAHWGAVYRGRFYYLMPSFAAEKWQSYSPGRLLLESLLEWCIGRRLGLFDFTIGGEAYKKDWCDESMPFFEHLRAVTPAGWPYAGYIRIRRWARRRPRIWTAVQMVYGWAYYGAGSQR